MVTQTYLTVRYAETDQMGIAHHSNYAVWFEAGRTDFLRKAGLPYSDIEKRGVLMPLYELSCRFILPARYEDELVVKTRLKSMTRVRIILSYEIIDTKTGALLSTGETQHAFTDKALHPLNAARALPDVWSLLEAACAGDHTK